MWPSVWKTVSSTLGATHMKKHNSAVEKLNFSKNKALWLKQNNESDSYLCEVYDIEWDLWKGRVHF